MKAGFIKLPRAIFELCPISRRFTRFEATADLFRRANYRKTNPTDHKESIELYPGELFHSTEGLSENWNWPQAEVERFLEALQNAGVLTRSRRGMSNVLSLHHDGRFWQAIDFPSKNSALPKRESLSSSLLEEPEEKILSSEDGGETAEDFPRAEWAEFLRQTILERRLGALNRTRLSELRAEFETKLTAEGRWPATTSLSGAASDLPGHTVPGRTRRPPDSPPATRTSDH
ncbi:hypothetical protein KKH27_04085 [bacterium]|nr:hypothetical protein [bacterium]MBU1983090.1 hypothetical protein [bacterium]